MSIGAAQRIRRWWRIARFALHLARGLAITAFLFPLQSRERRKREIEHWSLELLTLLRVRLFLHGRLPAYGVRPLMLVANHVSWLDIFAIDAIIPARFVAKAEVRRWPVVGWLSARAGTLFLNRARRRHTAHVNDSVARALLAGDICAVFPEGTTTDGTTLLEFHASLLESAVKAGAAVQPVAVWYDRSDGSICTEAAYEGGKSAWAALIGITSQHEILAHVCFLPPIATYGRHRRDVAREARDVIRRTLFPQARDSRIETDADLEVVEH